MLKSLVVVALCTPALAMALVQDPMALAQNPDTATAVPFGNIVGIDAPMRLAMGPDPGGHTGDGVTPTTTKSGQAGDNNQGSGQSSSSSATSQPAKSDAAKAKPADSSGTSAKPGANR